MLDNLKLYPSIYNWRPQLQNHLGSIRVEQPKTDAKAPPKNKNGEDLPLFVKVASVMDDLKGNVADWQRKHKQPLEDYSKTESMVVKTPPEDPWTLFELALRGDIIKQVQNWDITPRDENGVLHPSAINRFNDIHEVGIIRQKIIEEFNRYATTEQITRKQKRKDKFDEAVKKAAEELAKKVPPAPSADNTQK